MKSLGKQERLKFITELQPNILCIKKSELPDNVIQLFIYSL